MKEKQITDRNRWKRAFNLRRAIAPHVLLAGERPPFKGEDGPQRFVCLGDDLDDVLYAALEREAMIERNKHVAHSATGRRNTVRR